MAESALKFLFDRSFDSDEDEDAGLQEPMAEGEMPAEAAAEPEPAPEPPAPSFTEADLEKAKADGYAEGVAAGTRDATAAHEQLQVRTLDAVGKALNALLAKQANETDVLRHESISIALAVVRKLLPSLVTEHGLDEVERVVRDVLERMTNEPMVKIRVAANLRDDLSSRIESARAEIGHRGQIEVEADEQLAAGDCRVEWAQGGAARNMDTLWNAIDEIIERNLGPAPANMGAGPAPAAEN